MTVRKSTQKEDELKQKEENNKEKEFNINLREIKKLLNIKLTKKGEESRDDLEKIHEYIVQRDLEILRKKKNVKLQTQEFIKQRLTDPLYKEVSSTKTLGINGKLSDVAIAASDVSWKATSQPDGPRWKQRYEAWLASLPKGPTEEEIARWAKEKDEKSMWVKIQKGLVLEQHEVVRLAEIQQEKDRFE